jgi:hypothetical protein
MTVKPTTMCNGCIFATIENWKQVGCLANRSDKFKKQKIDGESEKVPDYYMLDGVCNMYRQDDGELTLEEQLTDQYNKVKPKITYFIIGDGDNPDCIAQTLVSIEDDADVHICLVQNGEKNIYPFTLGFTQNITTHGKIGDIQTINDFLSENMSKIKNSLICVLWAGYNVNEDIVAEMDDLLNIKLDRRVIYDFDDYYVFSSEVGRKVGYYAGRNLKDILTEIQEQNAN